MSEDLPGTKRPDADSIAPEHVKRDASDLRRRIAALSAAHPSSPGYAESSSRLRRSDRSSPEATAVGEARDLSDKPEGEERGAGPETGESLTDDEHAQRLREVGEKLADARRSHLATDYRHTADDLRKIWTKERALLHDEIIQEIYAGAADVPSDGMAILAGGLPGAGKTTVLTTRAGIDLSQYLIINPDEIKQCMATRGMVPGIDGLSPMEATELVHEESSYVAKQLALRAYADHKNVIWDITMSSTESTQGRIKELRAAGYGYIEGIFVDIPVEVSVRRTEARHREEQADYQEGRGLGGRYISPELIRAHADTDFGSTNRATFEAVKGGFDRWRLFDNSIDGRPAVLVEDSARSAADSMEEAT